MLIFRAICHPERSEGTRTSRFSTLFNLCAPNLDCEVPLRSSQLGMTSRYFLTTSAFSIMAMPPRSASLPFTVMFLPQYSAS